MKPTGCGKFSLPYATARAHVNANEAGKTFILAFNKEKSEAILCCPLKKLQKEHPYGLVEDDIFYKAEPGTPVPVEIT